MTGRAWRPTSQIIEVPGQVDKIPPYDQRSGEHLWLMMCGDGRLAVYRLLNSYRGWDGTHTPLLDQETLVILQGPGCFYCERPWSDLLARRRCPGRPVRS